MVQYINEFLPVFLVVLSAVLFIGLLFFEGDMKNSSDLARENRKLYHCESDENLPDSDKAVVGFSVVMSFVCLVIFSFGVYLLF